MAERPKTYKISLRSKSRRIASKLSVKTQNNTYLSEDVVALKNSPDFVENERKLAQIESKLCE